MERMFGEICSPTRWEGSPMGAIPHAELWVMPGLRSSSLSPLLSAKGHQQSWGQLQAEDMQSGCSQHSEPWTGLQRQFAGAGVCIGQA